MVHQTENFEAESTFVNIWETGSYSRFDQGFLNLAKETRTQTFLI